MVKLDGTGKDWGNQSILTRLSSAAHITVKFTRLFLAKTSKKSSSSRSIARTRKIFFLLLSYIILNWSFSTGIALACRWKTKAIILQTLLLDNDGNFVFAKFYKSSSSDYISKVAFVTKGATADTFSIKDAGTGESDFRRNKNKSR